MDVAFGILATTALALHNARRVYELTSGIKRAPKTVAQVSHDAKCLANTLESLQTILQEFAPSQNFAQDEMVSSVKKHLDTCLNTLSELEARINPYVRKSQPDKITIFGRLAFFFREKDVERLQRDLLSQKVSLDVVVGFSDL